MIRSILLHRDDDERSLAVKGSAWLGAGFLTTLGILVQREQDAATDTVLLATTTAILVGIAGYVVFRCARSEKSPSTVDQTVASRCGDPAEIPVTRAA